MLSTASPEFVRNVSTLANKSSIFPSLCGRNKGLMWGDLSVLTAGLVRLSGEVRALLAGRGESHPGELRARAEVEEGGRGRSRAVGEPSGGRSLD
jgi:hypothetical protein